MPVDSPDGTGGLINILCYKSNNFAGDFVSHFNIDIETCEQCVVVVKVIASIDKSAGKPICTANAARRGRHKDVSIEHPLELQKILSHLNTKHDEVVELLSPQSRAPPQISLFE
jgi:hypothetical protein